MSSASHVETWLRHSIQSLRRFSGPLQKVLTRLRNIFMPLAVGFILYVSWSSRDLLGDVLEGATVGGLLLAVALWSILHLNVPFFDFLILKGLGDRTRYITLSRIYLSRLPTKYLPGGIWHNVTRLLDLNRAEVPKPRLTALAILQVAVPACVAFMMGGALVYLDQGFAEWGFVGALAAAAATLLLIVTPWIINRSLLRESSRVTVFGYAGGVAMTAITWALASAAFYAYVSAYSILPAASSRWDVAGAYLMAWGTGFISIFTPQGLGVFEATAAGLITSSADFQVFLVIAAGFRIVILAADTLAWIVFLAARQVSTLRNP